MKATFFTLATLAASAFAAPAPYSEDTAPAPPADSYAEDAIPSVTAASGFPSASGIDAGRVSAATGFPEVPSVSETPSVPEVPEAGAPAIPEVPGAGAPSVPGVPEITGIEGLIELITGLVGELTGSFANIEALTGQVDSGESTPEEVEPAVLSELSSIQINLKTVLGQLTGQSGIPIVGGNLDGLLEVIQTLLDLVLSNGGTIAGAHGGSTQVLSILSTIFTILTSILAVVVGLVVGILPGLLKFLGPLLGSLSNGLVGPLLTPITGLVTGLASPDFVAALTETGPISGLTGSGLVTGLGGL